MAGFAERFLLIDLDGTLVDPAPGIVGSAQAALRALGAPVPAFEDMTWIIGPPLRQSFATLLGGADRAEAALAAYRDVYKGGEMFNATPYSSIFEALQACRDAGLALYLCTAKPLPFAAQIIERFGFSAYFEALYGAELDGRFDDKGDLIAHILKTRQLDAAQGQMIGDRGVDMSAAKRNGMASVGVLWGYGSEAELLEAGAERLCAAPAELPGCVLGQTKFS